MTLEEKREQEINVYVINKKVSHVKISRFLANNKDIHVSLLANGEYKAGCLWFIMRKILSIFFL